MTETTTRERLDVLFIEDSEVDVELAVLELERNGFVVSWSRVENAAELRRALEASRPQVILSDYSMPRFDGMEALKLARDRAPDLPFIFVSGTIGEERAIESMRGGATDYILKSNMRRLGTAVRRAISDVDAKRDAERVEQARARFAAILEATSDFVAVCEPDGALVHINSAGRALVGLPEGEVNVANILEFHPPWAIDLIRDEAWPVAATDGLWQGETALLGPDSLEIPVSHVIIAHRGIDRRVEYFATIARDIRDRKRYEERIAYLANYDALTGLPNRALLEDRVAQATAYQRHADRALALLVIDVDRFHLVNNGLGQAAGDSLLQVISGRLLEAVRDGDTVARLGADTYAVLATGLAQVDDVLGIARKLRECVSEPFEIAGRKVQTSVSIGASLYPRDGVDFESLLRNAETAMHRAKIQGHGGFQYYEAAMTRDVQERVELEDALRQALTEGHVELHYQPLISVRDSRVVGIEALMRWRHAERGWIAPDVFIPIAEHTDLIFELGDWALAESCRQVQAWADRTRGISVSVNVSARQFLSDGFADTVDRILRSSGMDPSRLVLELTESVLVKDLPEVARVFARLQKVGVKVAIDDFGTGYSSLTYLSQLPIDRLKIDKSFVQRYAKDEYGAEIMRAIISLGSALDMKVLAEGVETPDQLAFLREHGCDEAQGFLFSKALPPASIPDFITRNRSWPKD